MATIDTLQDSVNTLTSSTTALLDEVNVSKTTLTNSKDLAETAATNATASASAAATSATAASSSASSASTSASSAAASAASASQIVTGVATGRPSVRPSLNLDFVNSKTVDPRISFTRSTTATYYDGKTTAKAEENLVKYSQEFDNGAWVKSSITIGENVAVAPDGTTTADSLTDIDTATNERHRAYYSLGNIGSTEETVYSVYLKKGTVRYVAVGNVIGSFSDEGGAVFDLDTGTAIAGGVGAVISASNPVMTDVGNGWYRCSVTVVTNSTAASNFMVIHRNTAYTSGALNEEYTGDVANVTYVWGAQFEKERSSVTAYTPTTSAPITNYIPVLQTASVNAPRLDHDPVTGEAKGLLIEESRTNLHDFSEDFNNAAWVKDGLTITPNYAIAPNGTQTADMITATDVSYRNYRQIGKATSAITYTSSCYFKAGTSSYVNLHMDSGSVSNKAVMVVDLSTGTMAGAPYTTGNFSSASGSVQHVGNGWYRVILTFTSDALDRIRWHIFSTSTEEGKYIFAWGAQMEQGAFATSYIPTSGSQVTRSKEDVSITGTYFYDFFNQGEGTLAIKAMLPTNAVSYPCFGNLNGGNSTLQYLGFLKQASGYNAVYSECKDNSGTLAGATIGTSTPNVPFIMGVSYNNRTFYSTGSSSSETDIASRPITYAFDRLIIGSRKTDNLYVNGYVQKVIYYPQAINNSELDAYVQE